MDHPSKCCDLGPRFNSPTRRAAVTAILTAACIATNYMMIGLINVKFMDLIVYTAGFTFGPSTGASVGILTWLVYGTINPYGFSLPILAATSASESVYGIVGGLTARDHGLSETGLATNIKFAIIGFLLTFTYDLITNTASALTSGIPIPVALITGIPFAAAHEISNAAFFFVGASPLTTALSRLFQGETRNERE